MRGFGRFLVLLVVVLAVVYLGGWWYAQGRLAVAFHQQEQRLRAGGWTVTHGAEMRGRSPLMASYTVEHFTMTPPDQGLERPTITLPRLMLTIHPSAPFTLHFGLPLQWHVALTQGPSFTLRFTTIHEWERFAPNKLLNGQSANALSQGLLSFSGMRVDSANTNFTLFSVQSLETRFSRHPDAGTAGTALTTHTAIAGVALSPLFVTLGHLPFSGKLARFSLDLNLSGPGAILNGLTHMHMQPPADPTDPFARMTAQWQQAGPILHRWAQAGGHGTLGLALGLGPLQAQAHGAFGFDTNSQPEGKSVLTATGVGEFLGDLANAYPALVTMVSNLTAATAPYIAKTKSGKQRMMIDFALAKGTVTANGKVTGHVPPVVWPAGTAPANAAVPAAH